MVYAFMIRWSLCAKSEGDDEYLIALGNGCLEGVIALDLALHRNKKLGSVYTQHECDVQQFETVL